MPPCATRYALLVRLAWELRSISVSTLLAFPHYAEPVLYVPYLTGRRDAVLAVQRDGHWLLLWRGTELPADRLGAAAHQIAAGAACAAN